MFDILDSAASQLSLNAHLDIYIALSNDLSDRVNAEIEDSWGEGFVVDKSGAVIRQVRGTPRVDHPFVRAVRQYIIENRCIKAEFSLLANVAVSAHEAHIRSCWFGSLRFTLDIDAAYMRCTNSYNLF